MDYPGKVITKNQVTPTQISASGNWTVDDAVAAVKNNNWPVALVPNPISKSLRFNSPDTAYLTRTPATAPTNTDIGTWSFWVKRTKLGVEEYIFGSRDGANVTVTGIRFTSGDALEFLMFSAGTALARRVTTQVFRDPSAWYHFVIVYNSPSATANDRVKVYVNGVEIAITAFSTTTNPSQNQDMIRWAASGIPNYIGNEGTTPGNYGDYYLTETNYIDGQALTPSDFGLTNPQTGQWIPKKYTGTYGANGFYLNFKDATSTTTLGYDYSGNANNWTTTGFSVTAGTGNDSLTDVPTPWFAYNTTGDVGGVIRGNYATFNSVETNYGTLTNGNLNASLTVTGTTGRQARGTFLFPASGKYYFEVNPTTLGVAGQIGIAKFSSATNGGNGITPAFSAGDVYLYLSNGQKQDGVTSSAYGASYTTTNTIGVAVDVDNSTLTFYKDGVSQGTAYSSLTLRNYYPVVHAAGSTGTVVYDINFGQRPFASTPPAGFRSLCTTNLPPPTIGFGLTNQGDDYFNVLTYTGNGTDGRTVTGVGFNPDLVWVKGRSNAGANVLADSVRGSDKNLYSNLNDVETNPITGASGGGIGTVTTDGFVLEQGTVNMDLVNTNTRTYVAWAWKAAGSTVSNTAGSIASTVSANTTAGFSIVTYTGTGANDTVGHGCQVGGVATAPSMVIYKNRDALQNWMVTTTVIDGSNDYLFLNTTAAKADSADSAPTSTLLNLTTYGHNNGASQKIVAYCFAPVAGYSAFGSYTGNGSATEGPFVYTGFAPKFFMFKRTDTATGTLANSWAIKTAIIPGYNQNSSFLAAASSNQEDTGFGVDFLANGVKLKLNAVDGNASGGTYIYAAFAEFPFQFANAR